MDDLEKKLNNFLGESEKPKKENTETEFKEVCDKDTGECYTIKSKDGLIERVNKKMITEDGRTLLVG